METGMISLHELMSRYDTPYQVDDGGFDVDWMPGVAGAVDYTEQWQKLFAGLAKDKGCSSVVDNLVDELKRDGEFRETIVIKKAGCRSDWVEAGNCTDEPACCPERVLFGSHRVAAYNAAGISEFAVRYLQPDEEPAEWGEATHEVEVLYKVRAGDVTSEQYDHMASSLSFPVTHDVWVQVLMVSVGAEVDDGGEIVDGGGEEIAAFIELSDSDMPLLSQIVEHLTALMQHSLGRELAAPRVLETVYGDDPDSDDYTVTRLM